MKAVDGACLGASWGRYRGVNGGAMTEPWTVEADAARLGRHHGAEAGVGVAYPRSDSRNGSHMVQPGADASESMRLGAR